MMKKLLIFILIIFNITCANKKILIIGSYHKEYQFQNDYIDGIKNVLGEKYDYFEFDMDTKRIKMEEFKKSSDRAFDYYKTIKPDLVVLGDDNALEFLKDRFIKEEVPVVFLGINNNLRKYFDKRPANFTGVLERPLYQRNITFIKECIPYAKNIMMIFDNSETSKYIVEEAFEGKYLSKVLNVFVDIQLIGSEEAWKKTILEESDKYDAFVLGTYFTVKDKKNKIVDENSLLDWTVKNIKKPLFGTWSFSVGKGKTIGGLVLSGKNQGTEAGLIIKKILEKGEKASSIYPVTGSKGEYIISKNEANRWKIRIPERYDKEVILVE